MSEYVENLYVKVHGEADKRSFIDSTRESLIAAQRRADKDKIKFEAEFKNLNKNKEIQKILNGMKKEYTTFSRETQAQLNAMNMDDATESVRRYQKALRDIQNTYNTIVNKVRHSEEYGGLKELQPRTKKSLLGQYKEGYTESTISSAMRKSGLGGLADDKQIKKKFEEAMELRNVYKNIDQELKDFNGIPDDEEGLKRYIQRSRELILVSEQIISNLKEIGEVSKNNGLTIYDKALKKYVFPEKFKQNFIGKDGSFNIGKGIREQILNAEDALENILLRNGGFSDGLDAALRKAFENFKGDASNLFAGIENIAKGLVIVPEDELDRLRQAEQAVKNLGDNIKGLKKYAVDVDDTIESFNSTLTKSGEVSANQTKQFVAWYTRIQMLKDAGLTDFEFAPNLTDEYNRLLTNPTYTFDHIDYNQLAENVKKAAYAYDELADARKDVDNSSGSGFGFGSGSGNGNGIGIDPEGVEKIITTIAELSQKLEYINGNIVNINSSFDKIIGSDDFSKIDGEVTGIILPIQNIATELTEVSTAIGKLGDSGKVKPMVDELNELLGAIKNIRSALNSSEVNFNIIGGQGDMASKQADTKMDQYYESRLKDWRRRYQEILQISGQSEQAFLLGVGGQANKKGLYSSNPSDFAYEYSQAALSGLKDERAELEKIIELFDIIKRSTDSMGGSWKKVSEYAQSTPKTAKQSIRAKEREIYGIKRADNATVNADTVSNFIDKANIKSAEQDVESLSAMFNNLSSQLQGVIIRMTRLVEIAEEFKTTLSSSKIEEHINLNNNSEKLAEEAKSTALAVVDEGNKAESTSEEMNKLAVAKDKATQANKELASSAVATVGDVNKEAAAVIDATDEFKKYQETSEEAFNASGAVNGIRDKYADSGFEYQKASLTGYSDSAKEATLSVKYFNNELKESIEETYKLNTATAQLSGVQKSTWITDQGARNSAKTKESLLAFREYASAVSEFRGNLKNSLTYNSASSIDKLEDNVKNISTLWKSLDSSNLKDAYAYLSSIGNELTIFTEKFKVADNATDEFKSKVESAKEKVSNMVDDIRRMQSVDGNIDASSISQFEKLSDVIRECVSGISLLYENKKSPEFINSFSGSLDKLKIKISKLLDDSSSMPKKLKAELNDLYNRIDRTSEASAQSVRDFSAEFYNLNARIEATGKTGKSFFDMITSRAKGMSASLIAQWFSLYDIIRYAREAAQAVLEVNSAQIELRKVSDASDNELASYWDHATESAKLYGAEINEVINSAADWSRLGYNIEDAEKLADATTLLQRVGDNMTQESSAEGLISTLKGFGKAADEAEHIVDVINQIANTEPIDTAGLFEGLEKSASSLNAAGNTLEEASALITTANSVVQDPSSVGTAFKTISMRIRGAKTELEEMGEDTDGMVESTSKLQAEIKSLTGVDIMKDKNTFKSTYDILDELSQKWQDLTDIQQASVTELIAGKRSGNIISALMQNFDIARETLQTAENDSAGSAMKELENYQKGLQYSIDKFKTSLQDLETSALDSDFLKGLVDAGTGFISVLDDIIDRFGILAPLIAGGGAFAGIKNFGRYKNAVPQFEYAEGVVLKHRTKLCGFLHCA